MDLTNKDLIVERNSDTEIDSDDVGKPYIGQCFPTLDACYASYCLYAPKSDLMFVKVHRRST